ncbi:MAG: YgfZ/GcvT domain-containing protein [Prochlorotrichaceae cyanobacterium]|jgi:folate-binding protein YgfZ
MSSTSALLLFDSSHWGRLDISGADRLRFLHNQTTNTFQLRQPGEGCETLFVTSTARTLDLATAYIQADRVTLLLSPQRYQYLLTWLDRYIFPADQVVLSDRTAETCCFRLLGSAAAEVLTSLGVDSLPETEHAHHSGTIAAIPVLVARGSGLSQPGFTLIAAQADHDALQDLLLHPPSQESPQVLEAEDWEALRIRDGRPAADRELTEDYNPLEAGLWQTLSFDKGCYIGQETIARLNTYKGIKQRLWGIEFPQLPDLGPILTEAGEKIGQLTSISRTATGGFGLGYLRTKAGGEGLTVRVGDCTGTIVAVPFIHHELGEA